MNQRTNKKNKMVMKANASIKLCPEIKNKIDKTADLIGKILIGIIILCLIYIIYATLFPPKSGITPTEEEITKYCEQKNMLPNGYTTTYNQEKYLLIFKKRTEEQIYINCKTKYPTRYESPEPTTPECCYPSNCPQAINNPKYCNCIYLTYCIKKGDEYTQWTYKIIGNE